VVGLEHELHGKLGRGHRYWRKTTRFRAKRVNSSG
jgi:hypothetical protein